jgi:hypothetical protein
MLDWLFRVMVNLDPLPLTELTVIVPPRSFVKVLQIVRPNPQPNLFIYLLSEIFLNAENKSFNSF